MTLFPGAKVEVDAKMHLARVLETYKEACGAVDDEDLIIGSFLRTAAAVVQDAKISFNQNNIYALYHPLKRFFKEDHDGELTLLMKVLKLPLADMRGFLYKVLCKQGLVEDSEWCEDALP